MSALSTSSRWKRSGSTPWTSPTICAAGGVLVHVENRSALASHVLHLNPGDVATADVQSYAVDTTTGNDCGREGTLVVTAPHDSVAHTLPVSLPICSATISNVD